ncbi:MAG: Flp family type IVb pilin [Pseudomonadota bacterium]
MSKVHAFFRDESGATAIEYGLIAALIGTVIVAGITNVGSSTNDMYENLRATIGTAIS